MTNQVIANRYRLLRVLGEGAMGKVLLARDATTGDDVALKVILSGQPALSSVNAALRGSAAEKSALQFRQEFRLMTQLRHPNCCAVYDYGLSVAGEPFFTMEVVPGQGLDECLPLPRELFVAYFSQLLLALGYIHRQGFVHLDIKSANVRVRPDGVLKLMDYGLMEYAGQGSGTIRGTLPYLSPEMAKRAPVDQRSDLYSAGCLAYEMLTGHLPFVRKSAVEMLRAHLGEAPEPPSRLCADVPAALDAMVMRLLAKEPLERYQSADEVLEDLGFEAPAGIGGSLLTSPMVGRDAERRDLEAGLADLLAGRPAEARHLTGVLGIGKSRLLEEFRFLVQLEHLPYAHGASHEHQRLPYAPLISVLRGLMPALGHHAAAELAEAAPVLVRLLPELAVTPAPAIESPKHEMLRLQATLMMLLRALASRQPVVLVLEDWQWADLPSREFVAYLRRNMGDAAILLILTSQDAAPEAETESALRRLPGLSPPAVQRMVRNMLGSEHVADPFAEAVGLLAASNPLHIERLLEHLVKTGALTRHSGRWNTELDPRSVRLPGNLNALLGEKIAALTPAALAVARAAAAYDEAAGIDFLQAVTGLEDMVLFDALAALQRAQIVNLDAHEAYSFTQQQYQEALYMGLTAAERTALHATIARVLAERLGVQSVAQAPTELVMALAVHALQGHCVDEAIAYNLEAGRRANGLFALADAETFLVAGLHLITASGDARWQRERLDYLQLLGDVKRWQGLAKDAVELLQEAVAVAEAMSRKDGLGRLLTTLGKAHQMLGRYDDALSVCERAARVCDETGDEAGGARAWVTIGRIHFFQGRLDAGKQAAGRALTLAEASGDPGIIGLAYALSGFLYVVAEPEKLDDGVANLNRAVTILTEVGDRVALNDAYNLLGNAELMLGNFASARLAFEATAVISRENGLAEEVSVALVSLATAALEQGDYSGARAQAAQAGRLATEIDARFPLGMALVLEGAAAAYLGEAGEAEGLADRAVGLARELKNNYLLSVVLPRRIEASLALGHLDAALAGCGELEGLIAETGNTESEGVLYAWKAVASAYADQSNDAANAVARAWEPARRTQAKGILVLAGRAEALARMAKEDWPAAQPFATEALALAEQIGARGQAAELHGLLGEIALALGERTAADHFRAMALQAEAIGSAAQLAVARFGLAASEPYAAHAVALVEEAQAALATLTAELTPSAREAYLGLPDRRRVVAGNYVEFGLPRQRKQPPARGGFGLGWGGLT